MTKKDRLLKILVESYVPSEGAVYVLAGLPKPVKGCLWLLIDTMSKRACKLYLGCDTVAAWVERTRLTAAKIKPATPVERAARLKDDLSEDRGRLDQVAATRGWAEGNGSLAASSEPCGLAYVDADAPGLRLVEAVPSLSRFLK